MEVGKLILGITTLVGAAVIGISSMHHPDANPPEVIRYAAINAADQVRDVLSSNPSQIDAVDRNGDTALNIAAYRGYPDMVNLLIGSGPAIDRPNNEGYTPLAEAVLSGGKAQDRRLIVTSLIAAGANPQYTLPDGRSVIQLASSIHGARSPLVALLRGESAKSSGRVAVAQQ
jgi:ankyrin repeat protein